MQLSEQIAFNIVREVNSVIPININIMNAEGIIIASSNPTRIGRFHEAAYRIISDKIDELTVRYDGEFEGALKGINYSLKLQDLIVGVL
ncbi:MAG: sugar diacid recognition family protein, partial [Clostridiaceae bacterium]|nr:sugar diacid recognition family protein [Clostridiaceae bacterium]